MLKQYLDAVNRSSRHHHSVLLRILLSKAKALECKHDWYLGREKEAPDSDSSCCTFYALASTGESLLMSPASPQQ